MDNLSDKNLRITAIFLLSGIVLIILGVYLYKKHRDIEKYKESEAKRLKYLLEKKGWLNEKNFVRAANALGETQPPIPTQQCPENICPGLGKGFYLSKKNLKNPSELLDGTDIFIKVNSETCQRYRKGGRIIKDVVNTENTDDLISSVCSENNITGSLPIKVISVKPTLNTSTKYDIVKHKNIKTSRLILSNESSVVTFQNTNTCRRSNVNEEFLSDFKKLPVQINNPEKNIEWQSFNSFLNKWGSHVMTQIMFGSRFEHWESCINSNEDIQKSLAIKACLAIDGPAAEITLITANACSKYNSEEIKQAMKIETNQNTVIVGGTSKTRKDLIEKRDEVNLRNFLDSSDESNQAIGYQFTPIWEIYQQVSLNSGCIASLEGGDKSSEECKDLQRCLNLEAAYAYQAVKCGELKTTNGEVYQKFEKNDDILDINTYKCKASKEGCSHGSTDCHMGLGGCKAYGPSAFQKGDEYSEGKYRTDVRGLPSGGSHDGINNSCYFNGAHCSCDKLWSGGLSERLLWDQADRS